VRIELEPKYAGEDKNICVEFRRPGEQTTSVQTTFAKLQRLAGAGTCELADGRDTGVIPISAWGSFRVEVMVRAANAAVPVNESWLGWQRSPLVPAEVELTGADQPLVVDVDEDVLTKVLDELSRRR